MIAGLSAVASARAVALMELFRLTLFACITGNNDLHARNLAILQSASGEWRVAPAFDLVCKALYGDFEMALTIGGKRRDVLSRTEALAFAGEIGLPRRAADQVIDRLLAQVPLWMNRLEQLPFDANRIRELRRFLSRRQQLLAPA